LRIDVITPAELGPDGRASWRALQASDAALADPFHAPEWAEIIGTVRPDARVAVVEDGGQPVAYLPVQRSALGAAMGLGAPICDGDGVVALAGAALDLTELPRALRVDRIDFGHLPLATGRYETVARIRDEVMTADLSQWPEFLAARKAQGSSTLRNLDKKKRKMAREVGELEFRAFERDPQALAALMAWKSDQLERTNQPRILARAWCREAHERVANCSDTLFSGAMISLRCGGRLAAALLALRAGPHLHAWMIAHDPELAAYSPGAMVWHHMFEAGHAAGVRHIDFGCGDYPYKRFYANQTRQSGCGFVGVPSLASALRGSMFATRSLMERSSNQTLAGLPGRIMRRLDTLRGLAAPPMHTARALPAPG
jgi:CelD/BcsL family acetyltransferase involved in cellulose biosynthesis